MRVWPARGCLGLRRTLAQSRTISHNLAQSRTVSLDAHASWQAERGRLAVSFESARPFRRAHALAGPIDEGIRRPAPLRRASRHLDSAASSIATKDNKAQQETIKRNKRQ